MTKNTRSTTTTSRVVVLTVSVGLVAAAALITRLALGARDAHAGPIADALPAGYRDWRLISVAREEGELDDVRAILGNDAAIAAARGGARTFPDGAVIARLAWSLDPSAENDAAFGRRQSFVAGHPKNGVQLMFKDARAHASTGGWRYAQFDDGKPLLDAATLQACFECHRAVEQRDSVFTRYAP